MKIRVFFGIRIFYSIYIVVKNEALFSIYIYHSYQITYIIIM